MIALENGLERKYTFHVMVLKGMFLHAMRTCISI